MRGGGATACRCPTGKAWNGSECITCASEHTNSSTHACCSEITNCATYDGNCNCTACDSGYNLSGGACNSCSTGVYDDDGNCCESGAVNRHMAWGTCCAIRNNCVEYEDNCGCRTCEDGYYRAGDPADGPHLGYCYLITPSCSAFDENGNCCTSGAADELGRCHDNTIPHCNYYGMDDYCMGCESGYTPNSGGTACVKN